MNYRKHNLVFRLLEEDNKNVLKANYANHILHNATKYACDGLGLDIEMIILKIDGHFSISAKRREEFKSFLDIIDAECLEISLILLMLSCWRLFLMFPLIGFPWHKLWTDNTKLVTYEELFKKCD